MASEELREQIDSKRTIRSFVRRVGRITASQQNALDNLFEKYAITNKKTEFNFEEIFGRNAPCVLEIGFGNGSSLAEMAEASPEKNFIGIEVHRPGIGRLLSLVQEKNLSNVRVIDGDAVEILKNNISDQSLAGVQLFFPDPWPKKRHHKRRIVQKEWLDLIERKMAGAGVLHMATDWQNYAEHMLEVLEQHDKYENIVGQGEFSSRPDFRPETKFECRGKNLGHGVWDLLYRKK